MKKKNAAKIIVDQAKIIVNDEVIYNVGERFAREGKYTAFVQEDSQIQNDNYFAIIVHDCNPGCYENLDRVIVVNRKTGQHDEVKYWACFKDDIKNSSLRGPVLLDFTEDGNIEVSNSYSRTLIIKPAIMFGDAPKVGDCISPTFERSKPYTWFDYQIGEQNDIIIKRKKNVSREMLIELPGFDYNYDAFKLSGVITGYGQSYFMMIDFKNEKSWTVEYGNATTCTSGEIWRRRDSIVEYAMQALPTYERFKAQTMVETTPIDVDI